MSNRPNILFVFSDQHRAEATGCYANQTVRTPNFDRLAREGARAQTAVSNTPVCGPYRASLMTGRYVHNVNYPTNYLPFDPPGPTVAEVFHEAGYATGYIGKWHLHFPGGDTGGDQSQDPAKGFVPPGERHGFREYWAAFNGGHQYHRWVYYRDDDPTPIRVERYQPEVQVDQAIDFVRSQRNEENPWLLFLSWGPPHTPFDPPPGYADAYQGAPLPPNVPPGRPAEYARDVLPRYYGLVHSLDDAFGRLLEALDRMGVADDTIVVYTSDHGDMLGSHGYRGNKRWPHDASLRVPFMIRWPGMIEAGSIIRRPLGTPDLFPTLVDLAGLSVPEGLDGKSAKTALLTGDESDRDEYAFCVMPYAYVPWPGWRALRSARYLYARTKEKPWLLFDTQNDPYQLANLIDEPGHAALRRELDDLLIRRMEEIGDAWDDRVTLGDWEHWQPGTAKLRHNDLGVPWPGGDL